MSKGTPSKGKRHTPVHGKCRRCGSFSYNISKRYCAACGFGRSKRLRSYEWQDKAGLH
ncbi:MAG: 50S ribosomal protein L37e [Methanocellales archaeon]